MEEWEQREEEDCVAESNKAEKEGHVELQRRTADSGAFQHDSVSTIDDGGEEGQSVAEKELRGGFGGERVRDGGSSS